MNDFVVLAGVLALVVSLTVLAVAIRRSARLPQIESREDALALRVADLETQIERLEGTIATLQTLLYDRQRMIDQLTERVRQLEHGATAGGWTDTPPQRQRRSVLAVGIGQDQGLEQDLAALRGVCGVQLAVLRDVSKASLEALLERHRANGFPVRYLHLAVHAGQDGLALADGLADGLWLSRHLDGVEVLVIAGCESDRVGDLLSVVRHPITMRAEIEHRDAAIFTRAFWTEVGAGAPVDAALEEALRRSPSEVREMVEAHW